MKNGKLLDLYSDYLISAFGQTTATGLSSLLDGEVSHDQMQRSLASEAQTAADLWRIAKPHVRQIESEDGVAIVDDSIAEKPYTDENDIVCWHYDHSQQRTIKGINFVTCLYHSQGVSLPVGFELVRKTERYTDPKTGKEKRRSDKTKNEMYRDILQQAVKNQIPFQYALNDIWFASAENMNFVKLTLKKEFVMPLKGNRKVTLRVDSVSNRFVLSLAASGSELFVQNAYISIENFPLDQSAPSATWRHWVDYKRRPQAHHLRSFYIFSKDGVACLGRLKIPKPQTTIWSRAGNPGYTTVHCCGLRTSVWRD